MKKMIASLCFVAVTMVASAARADGEPTNTCVLPAGTDMACVASCFPSNVAPAPAVQPSCGSCTPDPAVNRRISKLSREYTTLRRQIDVQRTRIGELEGQIGVLGSRTADLESGLGEAKRQLEELTGQVERVMAAIALLIGDVEDLQREVEALKRTVGRLEGDLASLTKRVEILESRMGSPVRIGPRVGFLALRTTDGTTYTGGAIGPRLSLVLNKDWTIHLDADVLVSAGENPVGTRVRGGLGYVLTDWLDIEAGVGTAWTGYNDRLKARSNFTTGDIGLTANPFWKFEIAANLLLGAEFDQDSPSFVYGGLVELRLPLP